MPNESVDYMSTPIKERFLVGGRLYEFITGNGETEHRDSSFDTVRWRDAFGSRSIAEGVPMKTKTFMYFFSCHLRHVYLQCSTRRRKNTYHSSDFTPMFFLFCSKSILVRAKKIPSPLHLHTGILFAC